MTGNVGSSATRCSGLGPSNCCIGLTGLTASGARLLGVPVSTAGALPSLPRAQRRSLSCKAAICASLTPSNAFKRAVSVETSSSEILCCDLVVKQDGNEGMASSATSASTSSCGSSSITAYLADKFRRISSMASDSAARGVLPVTWLVLDRQDLGLLPSGPSGGSTGLGAASRAVESCEDFSGSLHLSECRPFSESNLILALLFGCS